MIELVFNTLGPKKSHCIDLMNQDTLKFVPFRLFMWIFAVLEQYNVRECVT